ncbi:MAG: hypothetical protein U1F43_06510 [Myxococcota bacterium]
MTSPIESIDWIVFGDDWGRHPSTTQHLVAHLPPEDRVVWVDSLGMRAPRLRWADARRVVERVGALLGERRSRRNSVAPPAGHPARHPALRVRPHVLPWHLVPAVVAANRALLRRQLGAMPGAVALVANPVAALYLDVVAPRRVLYLRLDRYADVPGVDPALVAQVEPAMIARADRIFAPNAWVMADLPPAKAELLPQGVDLERFAAVPLEPPATRVCGYWGWLGEWLDRELVARAAAAHPDWTFELRGPSRLPPEALALGPNVRVLPPVAHAELAAAAAHWRAAWAPLTLTHHMAHASPLKLREYLAAGLPTAATPIPEALALPAIRCVRTPDDVAGFLAAALADDAEQRRQRRRAVAGDSWASRAAVVRAAAAD